MSKEFELSMMGELIFFLGFQIKQCKDGIFIYQNKFVDELLKKYRVDQAKHARMPMATNEKLELDKDSKHISEKFYRGMIESHFILLLVVMTSCLVYVYVLDFKPPLKHLISVA